jgi:hypothetical protein
VGGGWEAFIKGRKAVKGGGKGEAHELQKTSIGGLDKVHGTISQRNFLFFFFYPIRFTLPAIGQ